MKRETNLFEFLQVHTESFSRRQHYTAEVIRVFCVKEFSNVGRYFLQNYKFILFEKEMTGEMELINMSRSELKTRTFTCSQSLIPSRGNCDDSININLRPSIPLNRKHSCEQSMDLLMIVFRFGLLVRVRTNMRKSIKEMSQWIHNMKKGNRNNELIMKQARLKVEQSSRKL